MVASTPAAVCMYSAFWLLIFTLAVRTEEAGRLDYFQSDVIFLYIVIYGDSFWGDGECRLQRSLHLSYIIHEHKRTIKIPRVHCTVYQMVTWPVLVNMKLRFHFLFECQITSKQPFLCDKRLIIAFCCFILQEDTSEEDQKLLLFLESEEKTNGKRAPTHAKYSSNSRCLNLRVFVL